MALRQNTTIRRLLTTQIPADFADWLHFVAIGALLAFTWQVEPIVFALLAVAMGLPYILVGPLAAYWIDRSGIRGVLIGSNLARALAIAAFTLAESWPVLLALVFLASSIDAAFTPAKQAAIQAATTPEDRMAANSISHAINQASKIVAPALGGALLIAFQPQQVFLLNAAISGLAAALLMRLPVIERPAPEDDGGPLAGLRAGWDEAMGKPRLKAALGLMAAGYFAMFFYDTLIAPLTRDLGFDPQTLGLALAAVGAGGVLGAGTLSLRPTERPFRLISISALVGGLCAACLGLAEAREGLPLAAFLGLFFAIGIASAATVVPIRTVLQSETRPDRMARVTALSEAANTSALLIAPFLGAALAAATTIGSAFVAGGAILLLIALAALVIHRRDP
ncbi:MFS transporter [Aestuariibius sp. 2305UL40-4]|uniref:MFS transporter n=1 Tax=Aestuariibius violaceus TaxID=3234132 RepID=UPI00345ED165